MIISLANFVIKKYKAVAKRQKRRKTSREQEERGKTLYTLTPDRPPLAANYLMMISGGSKTGVEPGGVFRTRDSKGLPAGLFNYPNLLL